MPNAEFAINPAKKRAQWVDITRVISAVLIIYAHVNALGPEYQSISDFTRSVFFNSRIPFFMLLAGFFCSLNLSIEKWRKKLLYLGVPLITWNAIYILAKKENLTLHGITGLGGFPANPALWFLRDIFIFTLITPLIARFKKHLFFVAMLCLIMSKSPSKLALYGIPYPSNFGWFCMGMCLSRWQLPEIKSFLSKGSVIICSVGLLLGSLRGYLFANEGKIFQNSGAEELFGIMIMCSLAIIIEDYLPRIASIISNLSSACFLSFVMHLLLLDRIGKPISHYIPIYAIPIMIELDPENRASG